MVLFVIRMAFVMIRMGVFTRPRPARRLRFFEIQTVELKKNPEMSLVLWVILPSKTGKHNTSHGPSYKRVMGVIFEDAVPQTFYLRKFMSQHDKA